MPCAVGGVQRVLWVPHYLMNKEITGNNEFPQTFAGHFNEKITSNVSRTKDHLGSVYNGKPKQIVQNINFMTENDVKKCLDELKNKKCEGFDRIPVCMLLDARVKLLLTIFYIQARLLARLDTITHDYC